MFRIQTPCFRDWEQGCPLGAAQGMTPICIKLMGIRDGNLGISEVLLIMRISRTMCLAQSTSWRRNIRMTRQRA